MTNAIEIKNLSKIYASSKKSKEPSRPALSDVSLNIPKGSIYGLLGPNGAGKSTLINILAGLVLKTEGSVKIWSSDLDKNTRQARASIGIVPQEVNLDPFFTPAQILDIQGGLYGVPKAERRTEELLAMVGLSDKADAYARSLSGGMKRRLMIAKALVHTPPILVLDEPTAGVDVELRQMLWENVRKLNKAGTTVVLTTHYLEEAEELCDRIAIINNGKIIKDASTKDLLGQIENKELRLTLDSAVPENIGEIIGANNTSIDSSHIITVRYNPAEMTAGAIIAKLQTLNLNIIDVSTQEPDLEDVFLSLTRAAKALA
jgi:ABC-2 type transport system ATP-binding protein